jgi:hypothetical protein
LFYLSEWRFSEIVIAVTVFTSGATFPGTQVAQMGNSAKSAIASRQDFQKFFDVAAEPEISRWSHALANAQIRSAVRDEIPRFSAASGIVRPVNVKYQTSGQ